MKTMTCKQMGGPCDAPIHGETAEEMMENGRTHIHSVDDEGHKKVITMMQEMQKDPEAGGKWNEQFQKDFDALPKE